MDLTSCHTEFRQLGKRAYSEYKHLQPDVEVAWPALHKMWPEVNGFRATNSDIEKSTYVGTSLYNSIKRLLVQYTHIKKVAIIY